ncbi:MAG: sensor histidine kinase [Firmicutes bacterium]|nr:sensor histidine kinase [Bacillota bacterium]
MRKELWRFTGIRRKLLIYYLIITVLMGVTSLFSYYNARSIITRLNSVFADYIYLNELYSDVNSLEIELEKYLSSRSSEALLNYYTLYNKLQEQAAKISSDLSDDQDDLMLKDIGNMIGSFLSEADAAVNAKRGRISSQYIRHFTRSNEISEYIKFYMNNLLYYKLQQGSARYQDISRNMTFISYLNLFLIAGSVIVSIFLALVFTYRITRPLIELYRAAERVSGGEFDIEPVEIKTGDEVKILAGAFNQMTVSIREYIEQIKRQAEMEKKLKEQEMQNLRMKSVLKDAELKALQSQINPHFLFNTLNAAAQLAMMEGADRSSQFIEKVAELFRYNLRRLAEPVKLEDEIKSVQAYMFILQTRFGDKLKFSSDIDEELLDTVVPCTIIQPVVENAFIHGIGDLEREGEIRLTVKGSDGLALIEVADNGGGMDAGKIKAIQAVDNRYDLSEGHVTGIGMHNVIDRLRLFYNVDDVHDVIELRSEVDKGTRVTLKIPRKGGKGRDG